jgi:hypothetical protein
LVEELGLEPGPELRALERAILVDDPALLAGGLPRARTVAPEQLPPDVADFTGREPVLADLRARLCADDPRAAPAIVALSGSWEWARPRSPSTPLTGCGTRSPTASCSSRCAAPRPSLLVMLGGRQRSADEYRRLLDAAGYRVQRVLATGAAGYPWSVIEAVKAGPRHAARRRTAADRR